ncbi:hypothetical protein AB0G04_25980 [Actinoplanes sp. NPDC023801]|uniref:hypothetical protein n=1 Tax=Actinoplanes sp. NPDC023801 TaxID=3154595 RepID=UPI003404A134
MVPFTEPLSDFPPPPSGGSRPVVVPLLFSGPADEHTGESPGAAAPGFRQFSPVESPFHPAESPSHPAESPSHPAESEAPR